MRAGRGRVTMSEIAGDIIEFDVSEGDTRLEGGSNRGNRARVWTHHRGEHVASCRGDLLAA